MKKKFDAVTAKKIINDYAEKLNFYMKENHNLKNQLEDTKTTLSINKDLLFKYISQSSKNVSTKENNNLIEELQKENSRVSEKLNLLFNDKTIIEKKLYKSQQELEDRIIADKEKFDKESHQLFLIENRLQEREYMIKHLKNELEKSYNNDIEAREIFLSDPDRTNLELYNELNSSRQLFAKITRMLNQEKLKVAQFENKIKDLEEKIQNLKKGKKISKNMDKISILDYITSDEDDLESNNESAFLNLESPIVIIPDKIKNTKLGHNNTFEGFLKIPKLDLTSVKAKYHHVKNLQIAEVDKIEKISNRSSNEYIEKLKFQMKVCKSTIKSMKKKIDKYKRVFEVQKNIIINLKNKNELLVLQLKKSTGSTNDDMSNNKKYDIENTSMNANTSVRFSDFEDDDQEDFNYVIKEYNRTITYSNTDCK